MKRKMGRNERCICGSGKKYKKCCIYSDTKEKDQIRSRIIQGDDFVSELTKKVANKFKELYKDHEVIDVSNVIDEKMYRPLQMQHMTKKMIMVVERNPQNNAIFKSRCPDIFDMMVLYRGAYECFKSEYFEEKGVDDVCCMIETRLAGDYYDNVIH